MTPDRRCPVCQLPLVYIREGTREDTRRLRQQQARAERLGFAVYRCAVHGVWRVYGKDGRIEPNEPPRL